MWKVTYHLWLYLSAIFAKTNRFKLDYSPPFKQFLFALCYSLFIIILNYKRNRNVWCKKIHVHVVEIKLYFFRVFHKDTLHCRPVQFSIKYHIKYYRQKKLHNSIKVFVLHVSLVYALVHVYCFNHLRILKKTWKKLNNEHHYTTTFFYIRLY